MNGPLTAVVIEDDPDLSEVLTALLHRCGFAVHAAVPGPDSVQAVRTHLPDLITTDLHVPGMDGLDAIRRIRAFTDAYIMIISASSDLEDVCMGLDAGADDFISQPLRPRILQARVQALQRRPRQGP